MFNFGRTPPPNSSRFNNYVRTLESILVQIGLEPSQIAIDTEDGMGWSFRRGSAVIEIYLSEQDEDGYFQVLSPIMHLPTTGLLPLYRRLLELNLQLTNAALGVHMDVVYVFYERPLQGLDAVEANGIITQVAGYADDLDDKLVEQFGGRLYAQT